MLTRISNIANPRKLGTIVQQRIVKLRIVFAVPGLRSRMLLVPYPLVDVPCGEGCHDRISPARLRVETLVGREENFGPVSFRSRRAETKIYVSDGLAPVVVEQGWKNLIVGVEYRRIGPP